MLLGRVPERDRIDRLVAGAREGRSGALLLRGEAGVGKTALLEYSAGSADGFQVLRAIGIESEASLAFSLEFGQICGRVGAHAASPGGAAFGDGE
jgi:hypothetical protein